jgi:hypothetical protein
VRKAEGRHCEHALKKKRLALSEVEGRGASSAAMIAANDLILRRRSG